MAHEEAVACLGRALQSFRSNPDIGLVARGTLLHRFGFVYEISFPTPSAEAGLIATVTQRIAQEHNLRPIIHREAEEGKIYCGFKTTLFVELKRKMIERSVDMGVLIREDHEIIILLAKDLEFAPAC